MATFSENQVRQLYVAKAYNASPSTVGDLKAAGDTNNKAMYIQQLGAGGLVRSDLILADNIIGVKKTAAASLATPLKRVKVTLGSDINSGAPVAGLDYLLRVVIRNYIGISDSDQYFKYGLVHVVASMTASNFYKTLALSLVKNFSKEISPIMNIYLETGGTAADAVGTVVKVTTATREATLTGTYTGIVLEEAEQDWILGVFPLTHVNFEVQTDEITYEGDSVLWGTVKEVAAATSIPDGKKIADLEYFLMGERGDQYRMTGFPNVIRTTYLVDSSLAYDVYDITYFYAGPNEDIQKSQKTISIVAPSGTVSTAVMTGLNAALSSAGSSLEFA